MSTREELEQNVRDAEDAWVVTLDAQDAAHTAWVDAQWALYSYYDDKEKQNEL
jgi:hypothetical protein